MTEINHSERKHARLSASGSERWINCPGSVRLEEIITSDPNYIELPSLFAKEGTLAHEIAEYCLINQIDTVDLASVGHFKKTVEQEGFDYYDMINNVQEYVDYVNAHKSEDYELLVEQKVDFSNIAPEGYGTCDAIIFDRTNFILHIFDLKYGKGVEVSAEKNSQGLLYAMGALDSYCFPKQIIDNLTLKIHIVQPRINNFSTYELDLLQHRDFMNKFKIAAQETQNPNAKLNPGEKQCKWCKAKNICPALFDKTKEGFEIIKNNSPEKITLEQKKYLLDNKSLFEEYLSNLTEEIIEHIRLGGEFEGYKLVRGRSVRKYNDDAEDILNQILPKDKIYKKELKPIGEIEKIIGKKEFADLNITIKGEGKLTLVPIEDKRLAVNFIDGFDEIKIEG